jgi:aminoglycoside phosphotransferase (APT) family kinase protein
VSAQAFGGGLFGKNVGLVTDSGRWVLRGDPWPTHSDEQFRRERFWASCIRESTRVPVPWPFHIDADESLFGWPYQLTPWMPGTEPHDVDGAAALGRTAAELRRITFDTFGEWSATTDTIAPFAGTASEWLRRRTEWWISQCATQSAPLSKSDLEFIDGLLPDGLDVVPSYVHHDLKLANCVCEAGEVSGLFDLGEGIVGDAIENLARGTWDLATRDPALVESFLRAYEEASGAAVPRSRLRNYVILDLLVVWEYGARPAQSWFEEPSFEAWATSFVAPVDATLG